MSFPLAEQLLFKPHQSLAEIVAAGWPVHVFVNPVEYHGPHLSLGNDRILSERIARKLHARLCASQGDIPFIVGGNIDFGSDPCPGKGSTGLTYGELRHLVLTLVDGLVALGIKRVIFHTFHGSPFHNQAIHAGMERLAKHGIKSLSVFDLVIRTIVDFSAERYVPLRACLASDEEFQRVLRCLPDDYHAGFFETSVALYAAGETVAADYTQLPPCPELHANPLLARLAEGLQPWWKNAAEIDHGAKTLAWMALKPFPGYTGIPSLASAQAGEFYVEELILPPYEKACLDVLWGSGSAPATPFAWSRPFARLLGGRF